MGQMETRKIDNAISVKAVSEDGSFEGYGSVFDTVDSYSERVAKGAFDASLRKKMPKLLWQHDPREVIGVFTEAREDDKGLFVRGQLAMKTQRGAEAYELMKMGAIDGLSIGFIPVRREKSDDEDVVTLTEVDLWETSVVTFPANGDARISAVKAFGSGETPEPSVLERALRDALGMSKRQARAFMAEGFTGLTERRDAVDDEVREKLLALRNTLRK